MIRKSFTPKTIQQKIGKPNIHWRKCLRSKGLKIDWIKGRNKIHTIRNTEKWCQNPVEIEQQNNNSCKKNSYKISFFSSKKYDIQAKNEHNHK